MEVAENSADTEWMDVAEKVQQRVVKEMGLTASRKFTIRDLRLAALRNPQIAFWVKHNRARTGDLTVGEAAPNVNLLRASDGQPRTLLDGCSSTDRTVVIAGSIT